MSTTPPPIGKMPDRGVTSRLKSTYRYFLATCVVVAGLAAFLANLSTIASVFSSRFGTQPTPSSTHAITLQVTPSPTSDGLQGSSSKETAAGDSHTWSNYMNAGGTEGPIVLGGSTILVDCKIMGFKVADGNPWWYRIAQSPWDGKYYDSADNFYNNGRTSGPLANTPWVDNHVPDC